MLEGNRCEICNEVVHGRRATYKQTKYCANCAKRRKKENTLNPWLPEEKREYMRTYMRSYRKQHPRLSSPYVRKHREKAREAVGDRSLYLRSVAWFLPLIVMAGLASGNVEISFDALPTLITHLEIVAVKVTGLAIVILICWRHLEGMLSKRGK